MKTSKPLRESWPAALAVATYALVFGFQLYQIFRLTHGRQLYPMDDVYIHAAVAKNLILHHIYGVSQFNYSFPCSSILWPFILALAFAVVGVKAFVPLLLNFVFAVIYLIFADRLLTVLAEKITPRMRAACLLLLVFGVPLLGISFEGMEHVLHALAILLLLFCYNRQQHLHSALWNALLVLSAGFSVAMRYESLFAVLMVSSLLFVRREWMLGLAVGGFSLTPVIAFGSYAHAHGSWFLPLPLLLKTSPLSQASLFTAPKNLFSLYALQGGITVCFAITAAGVILLLLRPSSGTTPLRDLLVILLGTFVLHAQLAQFGWLFRYEAYLLATTVVLAFAAVATLIGEAALMRLRFSPQHASAAFVAVMAIALAGRGQSMLRSIPRNAAAIYEQQYQTARFLAAFYPGQPVGLNDIGAPDFFAEIRSVDLLGLASSEVARLRMSGEFTRDAVARVAQERGVKIAVLYPEFFSDQIPYSWIPVSSMEVTNLPGKVQLGERRVTFYATDRQAAAELARSIEQFYPMLPAGVLVTAPGSQAESSWRSKPTLRQ